MPLVFDLIWLVSQAMDLRLPSPTIGKMPRATYDNPYEPPQTPSETPARWRARFHEWLVDRVMLAGCGCLSFAIVWGVTMLATFIFNWRS